MAKKNKKVEITNNPLESVTVGTIKTSKYSLLKLMLIILSFSLVIFFLPEIGNIYTKLTKKNYNNNNIIVPKNKPEKEEKNEEEPEKEETNKYIYLTDTKEIEFDKLLFENIQYSNNNISFDIINNDESTVNLKTKNIFFEVYNDKIFVQRYMLIGNIASKEKLSFSFPVNNLINSFNIVEISDKDYEIYDKTPDAEGNSNLICENETEKITYNFKNDKLVSLNDEISMNFSLQTYSYYLNLVNRYNSEENTGISASLNRNNGINYKVDIDFINLNTKLDNDYYFEKDASISEVHFIMSSLLFTCK